MKSKINFVGCCVLGTTILVVMLVFASAPQVAMACEPTPEQPGYIPPTPIPIETQVANIIQDTQVVLEGTVTTWVPGSDGNSILTVQVARYLKGHGPKTVKILGYFWICAPNFAFSEGSQAIFFVNGDPASTEPLQIRTWFNPQEGVVTSVINATGQKPAAPDSALGLLWVSLMVIIILGSLLWMRSLQK